ncbi:MAG: amidohydrolase, partial [Arenibacter sp.]|nr:amidohydrolase [Arenibacter sp.]
MRIPFLLLLTFLCCLPSGAQEYFPKNDGVKAENNNYTAFINAKIYVNPSEILDEGTLLIQNGKVVKTGKSLSLPKNTVVLDLTGKTIYPSFIDIYSDFGVEKPKRTSSSGRSAQY